MFRYLLPFAATALCGGCIPVTEPVGDIDKAEPDKALIGTWKNTFNNGVVQINLAPEVKGNPKGLMWIIINPEDKPDEGLWFFATTIGKQKYGNLCLDTEKKDRLDFRKEGEYEAWAKGKNRVYNVFKYTIGKDEVVTNYGDEKAFRAIAKDVEILKKDGAFETPVGWLAKYLDKNGSDKIFPAAQDEKWVRVKK